jgi:hypothetical protein
MEPRKAWDPEAYPFSGLTLCSYFVLMHHPARVFGVQLMARSKGASVTRHLLRV